MAVTSRTAGAAGLVVASVLAAALVGQLPAVGATPAPVEVRPASARQSLVCPGAAVAVGAQGTDADEFSATGSPVRTSGTAGGAKVVVKTLKRGDVEGGAAPRLLTAPAADSASGAIAGAQAETVAGGDAAGLAATACTAPTDDAWFAAGATTTGRTSVLTLVNPSGLDAQVTLSVWTEDGPVLDGPGRVTVPKRQRRSVSLASLAPSAGGTVVHVVSAGGRVAATLEQRTVRGLESGGVDLVGATAAPARSQVVPGLRIVGATTVATAQRADDYADLQPVVRVLLPGARAGEVAIRVRPTSGGQAVVAGRRVAARTVTDFPIAGLGDGTYTVEVRCDQPLVAGARVSVVGDASASTTPADAGPPLATDEEDEDGSAQPGSDAGLVGGDAPAPSPAPSSRSTPSGPTSTARGIDLAWLPAARPLTAAAAVAVVDGPEPLLVIRNPGAARRVRVSGAVDATVSLPAAGAATLPVRRGVLVLRGAGGTTAAVGYAGAGAIAGYPVAPTDQTARTVRVTR